MKKIAITCDEWYPWFSVEDYDQKYHNGDYEGIVEISDEDYLVYMGLFEQINRLQTKIGKLYDNNRSKRHLNRYASSLNSSGDTLPSTEAF